jgi:hypothetical protein
VGFLPHILGWFDGWNVFKDYVENANNTDNRTSNDPQDVIMQKNRPDEDVDYQVTTNVRV